MAFHPNSQSRLIEQGVDPVATIRSIIRKDTPWDSVVDFATHPSFCGSRLYPRQHTLLKLMFLETESMTDYDLDVIEGWRKGFARHRDVYGVQPDIWERIKYLKARGARRFPHIQFIGGRRGSKGLMGGILGAEQIAYFHSLDDWQRYYGVDAGKDGYLNIGATSQTQAKDQLFADIRSTVERCQYLHPYIAETKDHILSVRPPADIRRMGELKAAGVPIDHLVATLKVQALSSQSAAGRGATAFGIMLDEFAFMLQTGSSKSGDSIYEDWAPSLDQFDLDGLMYVPSSPYTRAGRCYSLYQQGSVLMETYTDREGGGEAAAAELKKMAAEKGTDLDEVHADPTMLIVHLPSWGAYEDWERGPELVNIRFKRPIQPGPDHESQRRRKLRNPEKFAVERAAQWAEVMGAYFDSDMVDRMFLPPTWRAPLEAQGRGYLDRRYRIHCDPGRTGANFALCIGHTEEMCPTCGWTPQVLGKRLSGIERHPKTCPGGTRPHVIIDLLHVWRPIDFPPDPETGKPTIDYAQVHDDLVGVLRAFPSTTKISFDQWNSSGFISQLCREFSPEIRVAEVTFTEKENQSRCEKVKSAINLGWVSSYADTFGPDGSCLLEQEMKYLSVRAGKVVKQSIGPITTKDLFDAYAVVVTDLLHNELERQGTQHMATGVFGSSNPVALRSGRDRNVSEEVGTRAAQNRARLAAWRETGRPKYEPSRLSSIRSRRP